MKKTLTALIVVSCSLLAFPAFTQGEPWPVKILQSTFGILTQDQIDEPINEISQGCGHRDCIPAIDDPEFASSDDTRRLDDDDLVLGLNYQGVVRAYPAYILNRHEVVNDSVNNTPIAITFCPLCGSGVAFRRDVGGKVLSFGVSGLLHNSDLILYDRNTASLWQQITGVAIAGPQRGQKLEEVPLTMVSWKHWRESHPDTVVLKGAPRTSYANKHPYGNYDNSKRLMFPANTSAGLILHPKKVVHGVRIDEGAAAVTERSFETNSRIEMQTGGVDLVWHREPDGSVLVQRAGSDVNLHPKRMFWFAWYSFNTDTVLRDIKPDHSD